MKTQTRFVCEKCGKVIEPGRGKIIQGNVYAVGETTEMRPGIYGSGTEAHMDTLLKEIEEHVYCDLCLVKDLGLQYLIQATPRDPSDEIKKLLSQKEYGVFGNTPPGTR